MHAPANASITFRHYNRVMMATVLRKIGDRVIVLSRTYGIMAVLAMDVVAIIHPE